jgi:choline-sulfatase
MAFGAQDDLAARQPNVLVIMSDEHSAKVLGAHGNRVVRTPHLDRLAGQGVTFDAAYCNSPLCVPSRLSFTAGKYVHRIAAWNNFCRLPADDYPSLPRALNAAGYESFLCGKQHYDAEHRYGFTEIGGNMNDNFMSGLGSRRSPTDETLNAKARARFDKFHVGEDSGVLSHDRRVTAGVLEFLSARPAGAPPFFLFAGFLAPHFPLVVPQAYWEHYRGRVPMPEIPEGFLDSLPLNYRQLRRGLGMLDVPDEVVRKSRELYYGLTEWLDEQVGTVLQALAQSAFAADTVVVYTTDHGENLGEHGLWWKNCMYEDATRVPLIVRWPKRWRGGQRRSGACSLVDLARTIAGLAGAQVPRDWDGESLLAWLDDGAAPWRDVAASQYYGGNVVSGIAMLRSGNWKYVYHSPPGGERELYDLGRDPDEFTNLAADPAQRSRVETLHRRLLEELGEHPDAIEQRCLRDLRTGYGRTPPA